MTDVFLLNMALCLMHHNVGARVAESEILWTVEVPSQLHRYQYNAIVLVRQIVGLPLT